MPERMRVSAPASSANLGPGFDCLAVALDLRNEIELRRANGEGLRIVVEGEGAEAVATGPDNLFVRAFAAAGGEIQGLELRMQNRVPFARGLGSSAATIAAGVAAGLAWSGRDDDPLELAADIEGHPDNVAAALAGGVTLAWRTPIGPRSLRLARCPVEFVAVVPEYELSTEQARAAIPPQVPHYDAAHTAGRAALLVAALDAGRTDLIADALDDRLHEPYRASLVPLLAEVRRRVADLPALGATLSGAGPAVLVWCEPGLAATVAAGLGGIQRAAPVQLAVAGDGARVE
jgi:homoserine kinase